jgi:hypothetical protein
LPAKLPPEIAVRGDEDAELTRRVHAERLIPIALLSPGTPPGFCTRAPSAGWRARPRSSRGCRELRRPTIFAAA